MPPKKESIYDEYFALVKQYEQKYGEKTVVLMQVGSFYEIYGYDISDSSAIGKTYEIAKLLNMKMPCKDKKFPVSAKNPYMVGFPCTADRHFDIIIAENYTMIIVDQENDGDKIVRKVKEILSPTMTLSSTEPKKTLTNQFVSVFIETQRIKTPVRNIKECENIAIAAGLSCIDVTTGKNIVCETYSIESNKILAIQETYRFLVSQSPREVLIEVGFLHKDYHELYKNFLKSHLELERYPMVSIKFDSIPFNFRKIDYQEPFLEKVFSGPKTLEKGLTKTVKTDIIKTIELEEQTYGRISYMMLLQYCYEHNPALITNINKPIVGWMTLTDHLQLAHNAIDQLHLLPPAPAPGSCNSILSIVDKTVTNLGKKYLKSMLINPLTDIETLNFFYSLNEECKPLMNYVQQKLKTIHDIEKLHRKLSLALISPTELANLFTSYKTINEVHNYLSDHNSKSGDCIQQLLLDDETHKNFNLALKKIYTSVDMDILMTSEYKKGRIITDNSFLKEGIDTNIDLCQKNINLNMLTIHNIMKHLSSFFKDGPIILARTGKASDEEFETSEDSTEDPPVKEVAKGKGAKVAKVAKAAKAVKTAKDKKKKLSPSIMDVPVLLISDSKGAKLQNMNYDSKLCGTLKISSYKAKKSIISSAIIDKLLLNVETSRVSMLDYLSIFYRKLLFELYSFTFSSEVNSFVAILDYACSNARVSLENKYYRPKIVDKEGPSFLEYKDFRHPLIEKIISADYVPNDIGLGHMTNCSKGALLFGLNSSGKCFAPETEILMYKGGKKFAKDIQSGELLMGDDSTPRKVLSTTQGKGLMYKVVPQGFKPFIVNGPHILCLKSLGKKGFRKWQNVEGKTMYQIYWIDDNHDIQIRHFPYTDNNEIEILRKIKAVLDIIQSNEELLEISVDKFLSKSKLWKENYTLYKVGANYPKKETPVCPYEYGMTVKSSISDEYLYNSFEKRCQLLAGIFSGPNMKITLKLDSPLRPDVINLLLGLNMRYHLIGNDILIDNVEKPRNLKEEVPIPFTIEEIGFDSYVGFSTDMNQRFLLGDYIVTHNSSLTRAIGLGIIMAQAGMFVPGHLTYRPYNKILTRLTGNDDMLHGKSSFIVEMLELRTILRCSDENTLVLGDEACRGTENLSGSAIAVTMIQTLVEKGATFIMSTHLHHLPEIEDIKVIPLKDLRICHLTTLYDEKEDSLIFERKLKDGPGKSTYGIEVAKYLGLDPKFIAQAEKIRKKLANEGSLLLSDKQSNYNSKVYMDSCLLCDSKESLQTHHIEEQRYADKNGFIGDKHMNRKINLITLCEKCHTNLHSNHQKIVVNTMGLNDCRKVYQIVNE